MELARIALSNKMETKSRITSVLKANSLDFSITGFQEFNLSELELVCNLEFQLPTNIRLGHLVEKIVSELIKSSSNYEVIYENTQLIQDKITIGEIDFIIKKLETNQLIHLELAYKFYLFDPTISSEPISNWIGPNRNDSLKEKLDKLKKQQFPLLYHNSAKLKFKNIKYSKVSQALCLLVSLFIPYESDLSLIQKYQNAIRGYYLNFETFKSLDSRGKKYHIPSKKEWGIDPYDNENWTGFDEVVKHINTSIKESQSLLIWQKNKDVHTAFFITWW